MAYNRSQVISRVALRCGNLQTTDPWYTTFLEPTGAAANSVVNSALDFLVLRTLAKNRKKLNLFPELREVWTSNATTTNDTAYVSLPDNILIVTDVFSFDSSTAPTHSTSTRKEMRELDSFNDWLLMSKTQTGYPRSWVRHGERIYLHPVPDTSYLTYYEIIGIAKETRLTGSSDTPRLNTLWHEAWVDAATYLMADAMGFRDDADAALVALDQKITNTIGIIGLEESSGESFSKVYGDPTN